MVFWISKPVSEHHEQLVAPQGLSKLKGFFNFSFLVWSFKVL